MRLQTSNTLYIKAEAVFVSRMQGLVERAICLSVENRAHVNVKRKFPHFELVKLNAVYITSWLSGD